MKPSDALVRHYLATSRVMRLATLSGRGAPSLTPIWFVVSDGLIIATTAASTAAARNIAIEPRVTVLLDGEAAGPSDAVLRVRGLGKVHDGLPRVGVLAQFATKYYLARGGLRSELRNVRRWRLRMQYYASSAGVWLAIRPIGADVLVAPGGGAPEWGPSTLPISGRSR